MSATEVQCPEPGCPGVVDADGYCNVSGMKVSTLAPERLEARPAASSAPASTSASASSGPVTTSLGTRTVGTGAVAGATAVSRTGTRSSLGLGLVEIPRIETVDPATVVMQNPEVPESHRFCANCGEPVGRSKDGRPGRTEGYCAKCGHPFSFTPKLAPGDRVGGQYEVVGCLAHGGLGWVYLARDRNVDDKWVVLKGLLNTGDTEALDLVFAELKFLAEVDHANIVRVINFVPYDNQPYIVMDYVGGTSLLDMVRARRPDPLPVTHAISYMLEVLQAFAYLHERGLLYNDFKPDNVMQTGDTIKLIDLGAVQRVTDVDRDTYGTKGYQAPEIAELGPSVSSDLYTVARSLAFLCTNFRGFTTSYEFTIPAPDVQPLYARHDSLYQLLLRATAPSPVDRFQSADDMADQLAGVLREIVAVEEGRTSHAVSLRFTNELRTATDASDWRALPIPLVDGNDPAAGYLAAVSPTDLDELLALLDAAPGPSLEVGLRRVRALLDAGRADEARAALDHVAADARGEWRVAWHEGLYALATHEPETAFDAFASVYRALPGELAPKLALGTASEGAGDAATAERWYDLVSRTDARFTSAAFGLARCLLGRGERDAAVAAFDRVPDSSSAYVDAQIAKTEAMIEAVDDGLTVDRVLAAARVVDGLGPKLPSEPRARLTALVLQSALDVVPPEPNGATRTVLGNELTDEGIRLGLERTYRELARQARDPGVRIELVDEANRLRPRTLT